MKTKNTDEYRGEVMTHLTYIKEKVDANFEHLERVNGSFTLRRGFQISKNDKVCLSE